MISGQLVLVDSTGRVGSYPAVDAGSSRRDPLRGMWLACMVALMGLAGSVRPCLAQANGPVAISPDALGYADPDIVLDLANNVLIAYSKQDDIWYTTSVNFFQTQFNITNNPLIAARPAIASGTLGTSTVVFEQQGTLPMAVGSDILLATNNGGPFTAPVNVTFSAAPERHPVVTRTIGGVLHVAWEAESTPGSPTVHFRENNQAPMLVASGQRPSLAEATTGTLVAYERAGALYLRLWSGGALAAEQPLGSDPGASHVDLATDGTGGVYAVFLIGDAVHFIQDVGSGFEPSVLLEAGPISGRPRLAANAAGHLAVTYELAGQIIVRQASPGGSFGAPLGVSGSSTTARTPAIVVDSLNYFHAVYEDGGLFVVNNVPAPIVNFTATPTSGEILLDVQFESLASGVISSYSWDFGDGNTSNQVHPEHTYTTAGARTVSLTCTGPGGAVTHIKSNYVHVLAPTHVTEIPHILVNPAQQTVRHPVYMTHTGFMQGFQVVGEFNNSVTPLTPSLTGTVTQAAGPEFVVINTSPAPGGAGSWFMIVVVLDLDPPFLGQTIQPGTRQIAATLNYNMPIGLSLGTSAAITLVNGVYPPSPGQPLMNVMTQNGLSILPFLLSGSTTVTTTPGTLFLRGDSNHNGGVDLADAIFILGFLFSSGPTPPCPDAADVNDDGVHNIADAIYLLSYLFSGGPPPRYPFPTYGIDPSADALAPCSP